MLITRKPATLSVVKQTIIRVTYEGFSESHNIVLSSVCQNLIDILKVIKNNPDIEPFCSERMQLVNHLKDLQIIGEILDGLGGKELIDAVIEKIVAEEYRDAIYSIWRNS